METSQNVETTVAATLFTLPIHFKRWAADSKGHKDLLALAAKGGIADFEKEVEVSKDDEGKEVFKRKSLSFNVSTLDCAAVLAGSGLTAVQIDHVQELINAAIKKDVQAKVADADRVSPVSQDDLPNWESVLSQAFNKRPTSVKVTMDMVNAATANVKAFLESEGVKEGGITFTTALCTKKFSIATLNSVKIPVVEKIQVLIEGWYEQLSEAEQDLHFPVVALWDANLKAKLNPAQEDVDVDMF